MSDRALETIEPAIHSLHAHVYFADATERERAAQLREGIAARFRVRLGRWHEVPVGPHTVPMYQVAFEPHVFAALVSWLMLHRMGLSVLVHPNTGRPRDDHLVHALWLGQPLALKADVLPEAEALSEADTVVPNTAGAGSGEAP